LQPSPQQQSPTGGPLGQKRFPGLAATGAGAVLVAGVLTGAPNTNPTPAMDAAVERDQQAVDAYWETLGI